MPSAISGLLPFPQVKMDMAIASEFFNVVNPFTIFSTVQVLFLQISLVPVLVHISKECVYLEVQRSFQVFSFTRLSQKAAF